MPNSRPAEPVSSQVTSGGSGLRRLIADTRQLATRRRRHWPGPPTWPRGSRSRRRHDQIARDPPCLATMPFPNTADLQACQPDIRQEIIRHFAQRRIVASGSDVPGKRQEYPVREGSRAAGEAMEMLRLAETALRSDGSHRHRYGPCGSLNRLFGTMILTGRRRWRPLRGVCDIGGSRATGGV